MISNLSTYILIGVFFMFFMESFLRSKTAQKHIDTKINRLGIWEVLMGILFWPLLITVFFYNFFKQLFK